MRTFFLRILILALFSIQIFGCAVAPTEDQNSSKGLAILQGPTGFKSSRFVVLRTSRDRFKYFIKGSASEEIPLTIEKSIELNGQAQMMDHLMVHDLNIPGPYLFLVRSEKTKELVDEREFHLLKPQTELRIAVASCMDDSYVKEQRQIWPELLSHSPDLLLLIGDNVYVNHLNGNRVEKMTPSILLQRYLQTRQNLELFRAKKLVPVFAVWDDNDYGENNGGKDFPLKTESQDIFRSFFHQSLDSENLTLGPGISSQITLGDLDIFLLDNRSFRTKDREEGPEASHFGKDQENWLFEKINPERDVILVSGDQWFGGYQPFESFEGDHPKNFKSFMGRLKNKKMKKIVFVSGDRHLTEIIKVKKSWVGRSTYELTSSGIHARTYPGAFKTNPSPNQFVGQDGALNYMIVDWPKRPAKKIRVRALGLNKQVFFDKYLNLN